MIIAGISARSLCLSLAIHGGMIVALLGGSGLGHVGWLEALGKNSGRGHSMSLLPGNFTATIVKLEESSSTNKKPLVSEVSLQGKIAKNNFAPLQPEKSLKQHRRQAQTGQPANAHVQQDKVPPDASTNSVGVGALGGGGGGNSGALSLVMPVALLELPQPAYPEISRKRGQEGRVVLEVAVDATGTVEKVALAESSGFALLDAAAAAALKKARFAPASFGGVPIPAQKKLAFVFSLRDQ